MRMYKIGVSSIANFEDDVNSFIKDNLIIELWL